MKKFIYLSAGLLAFTLHTGTLCGQTVDFAVFRLDYETCNVTGVAEFSQDYHKALPEPNTQIGNIFVTRVPPGDFGYTLIESRLTRQRIFEASVVWMGMGELIFPGESDFTSALTNGFSNPEPDTLICLFNDDGIPADYTGAWNAVKSSNIINDLASEYPYDVVVFPHIYGAGGSPPNPELFVIAYNIPPAPKDIGIVEVVWPKTAQTLDIPAQPELLIYNFSDGEVDLSAEMTITDPDNSYGSIKNISSLARDSYYSVKFDCFTSQNPNDFQISFFLRSSDGTLLQDKIAENNEIQDTIKVSAFPVFKYMDLAADICYYADLRALDFDGDGDNDIVQWGNDLEINLIRNDGDRSFSPVLNTSELYIPGSTREVVAADLTGNTYPDLLVISYLQHPVLYQGDGSGEFEDITSASNLDFVTASWDVKTIDLENDNDIDLIFQSGNQEIIAKNNGSGVFSDFTPESGITDPYNTSGIAVGDLNNDLFNDVVLANWDGPSRIFLNDGDGSFTELSTGWIFTYCRGAVIFDLDNDGAKDILFLRALYDEKSLLYQSSGDFGSGNPFTRKAELPGSFHGDAADLNGDGNAEILIDNYLFSYLEDEISDISWSLSENSIAGGQFADLDGDDLTDIFYRGCFINQNNATCTGFVTVPLTEAPIREMNVSIYPNPANENLRIDYSLNEDAHVKIVVLDLCGKVVADIYNARQTAGHHRMEWNITGTDPAGLSPGVYMVQIETNRSKATKKVVLGL